MEQAVAAESIVGIYLNRSPEMIIGLAGVLKAGGAYLPLDPAYPAQRVAFMLEDAEAGVVLTHSSMSGELEGLRVKVVEIDRQKLSGYSTDNTGVKVSQQGLACVTYTSGSTGIPKGVMVTQQAVVRLVSQPGYVKLGADHILL